MTWIKKLLTFVLIVAAPAVVAAQNQSQTQTPAQAEWQRMLDLGLKYGKASELYLALKSAAHGGQQSPAFAQLPDWSGLWTASGGGSFFGRGPTGVSPKLTAAAADALKKGSDLEAKGISYDENLSDCGPPGFPRWLVIPFLREFILRPEQTWLSSETVNNVRRIYTDGRDHPPVDDRYPLYYGDSIGFWDGPKLVIHTNQLMKRSMGRNQPEQSEQMETVEVWEKIAPRTIEARVWIYDPALYLEPWYLTRLYTQADNPDKSIRMNYWHCSENPNNAVYKTPDGSTQYREFTFGDKDKR
jgi:hypothetical protein